MEEGATLGGMVDESDTGAGVDVDENVNNVCFSVLVCAVLSL